MFSTDSVYSNNQPVYIKSWKGFQNDADWVWLSSNQIPAEISKSETEPELSI